MPLVILHLTSEQYQQLYSHHVALYCCVLFSFLTPVFTKGPEQASKTEDNVKLSSNKLLPKSNVSLFFKTTWLVIDFYFLNVISSREELWLWLILALILK